MMRERLDWVWYLYVSKESLPSTLGILECWDAEKENDGFMIEQLVGEYLEKSK